MTAWALVELLQITESFTPLISVPRAVPNTEQDKIPTRIILTGNICPTITDIWLRMTGTTGGTMDGAWQTMSGTCPMGHTGWPRIGPVFRILTYMWRIKDHIDD